MLKITLLLEEKDNRKVKNILVPENKTIREVLIGNHIDYNQSDVLVNALPINGSALDTKFSTMSAETSHYIIQVNATHEMMEETGFHGLISTSDYPRAYIFGSTCIVVSALSLDEILAVKNSNPDLMKLKNEYNESIFAIDVENGFGSIKEYGAVYSQHRTREGKATITILLDPSEQDYFNMLQEKLSASLEKLAALEHHILVEKYGYEDDDDHNGNLIITL